MAELLKILIIDDDEVDRMTVQRSLKTAAIAAKITQADTGQAGLNFIRQQRFDCVIVDFKLPDMDGLELIVHLREADANVPVLLITSYGDERVAAEAIKAGASDYISKSLLTPEGISHSLRAAIRLHQAEKQKQDAELNLQSTQQQLNTIIQNTPLVLWGINKEGIFDFCFGKGLSLIGLTTEQVIGKPYYEVFAQSPGLLAKIRLALTGEITKATNEINGFYFESIYQPLLDEQNEITGISGLSFDITDRVISEEALSKARDVAEQSIKIKEQFFTNMSHEIRTPLNGIIGLTGVLQKTTLTEEQRTYLDAIATSGDRLLTIINDLLDFSKMDAGKIELEETSFNLRSLLKETVEILELSARTRNNRLKVIIDPEVPLEITGDPARLNQVLTNLIGNAIKFTENGQVRILIDNIQETADSVVLEFEIQDSGIGIPEEKLNSIFESFTQASSDTTRKYGGTGLGLTISRQLIELQGGKLNVRSKLNEGSTFSFNLKFKKSASEPETIVQETELDPKELGELQILLAEDNEINQLLAKKIITDWGFKLDIAGNGRIAVDLLREKHYDLILMDMQMPEMDGYEAISYIRTKMKEKSNIPIIAFTAHATKMEIGKCMLAGANSYVSKPLKPEQLLSEIFDQVTGDPGVVFKPDFEEPQEGFTDTGEISVNLSFLKEMAGSNLEFMEEVIDLFIKTTPDTLNQIKDAASANDWNTVKALAHRLKSSMFLLGINELELNMAAIEQSAQNPPERIHVGEIIARTLRITEVAITQLKAEKKFLS